jgi:hypothetical protein
MLQLCHSQRLTRHVPLPLLLLLLLLGWRRRRRRVDTAACCCCLELVKRELAAQHRSICGCGRRAWLLAMLLLRWRGWRLAVCAGHVKEPRAAGVAAARQAALMVQVQRVLPAVRTLLLLLLLLLVIAVATQESHIILVLALQEQRQQWQWQERQALVCSYKARHPV